MMNLDDVDISFCLCYFIGVSTQKCFYFDKKGIGGHMAEVRKKGKIEQYNLDELQVKSNTKDKNNSKVQKVRKTVKSAKNKELSGEKKTNLWIRFRIFCHGVKSEFQKVHWPSRNDMCKYSVATIFFVVFCSLFFYLIDVIFALVQSVFK